MDTTAQWYYARDRRRVGPLSREQLQDLVRGGQLKPADMVLQEGTTQWRSAETVPDLFILPSLAPTVPQPPAAFPVTLPPEACPATPPVAVALPPYPNIPGYEVLSELGRGGMGVVYKARDTRLKRFVALKMILGGVHAGAEELARFKAEARAVAQLQHANIVQVHEIGDKDGLPYFSLEFVEGGSLAQRLMGTPLPIRSAAELTETLARAIHHAHQRGIIHRDLKPANVLLALSDASQKRPPDRRFCEASLNECVPKITDFGLAKQLAEDSRTQTGAIMGTPSYMAPEQAEGRIADIGPWTDVYALGALLYEFLTGRPPFRGDSPWDVVRHVREDEPEPPRRLNKKLSRDLETICLKCLEKAPARRYPSAEDLAEDLRRFLAHEPIQARPVSRVGRAARWCRRYPARAATVGLGALAAVAVVILLLGLRSAGIHRQQAHRDAGQYLNRAEELVAERQYLAARDPLLRAQTLLQQYPADGSTPERLQSLLDKVDLRLRLEAFRDSAKDAEYHLLGTLWTGLSADGRPVRRAVVSKRGADLDRGVTAARAALKALHLDGTSATAADLNRQGIDADELGPLRTRASEVLLLLALALQRLAGEGKAELRQQAVAPLRLAEALDDRSPELYRTRAGLLRVLGRKQEADEDEGKVGRPPATFLDHHLRAGALHRKGRWPQALDAYQAAGRLRPEEYWTLFRLGKVLENLRRLGEAESVFLACIALRPNDPTAYNNRGTILLARRKYPEAAAAFEVALARDPDYLPAYGNLMLAHAERKQVAEAEKVYRRYLARQPGDRRDHSQALNSLGLACERGGQLDKALEHYDAALRQDATNALVHRNRALLLAGKGRDREAEEAIGKAIAADPSSGELKYVQGNIYAGQGHASKARRAYTEAVELSPGLWNAWYNRGVLRRRERDYEGAIEDQTRALKLFPECPEALHERALALAASKRFVEALADVNRLDNTHGEKGEVLRLRGKILGDMGQLKKSEEELTRAIEEAPKEANGYRSRAVTRQRAKNWQGAIDDFQEYLRLAPDAADAASIHNDLSVAYLKLGQKDKAEGALNKSVKLRPTPGVLTNRGFFYLIVGLPARAVPDFSAALKQDKGYARAWALRGQAYLRLGCFADAEADFTRALEIPPVYYETRLHLALAHHLRGADKEARASLKPVIDEIPNRLRGKFARGSLHFLDGAWPEAIVLLSQAADDETLAPWVRLLRARAWLKLGGRGLSAALADAEALVTFLPGDGLAHLQAARIHARVLKEAGPTERERLRARTLGLLESAVKRQPELARVLGVDAELEPLRQEPRFQALLRPPATTPSPDG